MKNLEKTIAALDGQRGELNAKMLNCTDANEAMRLHNEIAAMREQSPPRRTLTRVAAIRLKRALVTITRDRAVGAAGITSRS
ncbi:MAG: hypothetical protein U0791_06505 [Gemmataceae bacterium]